MMPVPAPGSPAGLPARVFTRQISSAPRPDPAPSLRGQPGYSAGAGT